MRRAALAPVVLAMLLAACSGGSPGPQPSAPPSRSTSAQPNASHGPFFPECGGVSDQTLSQLTGVPGLVVTARNPTGCQWLVGGGITGPWFSFSWYRGSPIGRERKSEELTRTSVDDITIAGHNGFIAKSIDARLGERLCDVGIQYQDDFFEWSVRFTRKPFPSPCDVAVELARQSIAAAK